MSRVSNTHSVSIASGVIATQAATMSVGSWLEITSLVSSQNAVLGVGGTSGSMTTYSNAAAWNPISKAIEFVGKDAGVIPWRHIRYIDSTGSFSTIDSSISNLSGQSGHGYDHVAVDPLTGDLYYRQCNSNIFLRKAFGAGAFSTIPSASGYAQIAVGACWWSGAFTGGSGSWTSGGLILYNSTSGGNPEGQLLAFDKAANAWTFNVTGIAPGSFGGGNNYHTLCEYSAAKNVAVYGGGDVQPTKLWRLNANGTTTAMPDVPSGKGAGIQRGALTCDPVSGNFLLFSSQSNASGYGNAQLWELNPTGSGTWTQQTGVRAPPVGSPNPSGGSLSQGVVMCPVSDYDVTAIIEQTTSTQHTFWLYKHA